MLQSTQNFSPFSKVPDIHGSSKVISLEDSQLFAARTSEEQGLILRRSRQVILAETADHWHYEI